MLFLGCLKSWQKCNLCFFFVPFFWSPFSCLLLPPAPLLLDAPGIHGQSWLLRGGSGCAGVDRTGGSDFGGKLDLNSISKLKKKKSIIVILREKFS